MHFCKHFVTNVPKATVMKDSFSPNSKPVIFKKALLLSYTALWAVTWKFYVQEEMSILHHNFLISVIVIWILIRITGEIRQNYPCATDRHVRELPREFDTVSEWEFWNIVRIITRTRIFSTTPISFTMITLYNTSHIVTVH